MDVRVLPLQRVLSVAPGTNLLDALRQAGIPVSYSCMAGRCGTCRCTLVGQEGFVLACQTRLTEPCTVQIPEPDEVVVHPARSLKATVRAIEAPTHDIRRLLLHTARPLAYTPGQYAQLQFGPGLARPYSMAGLPEADTLEFHVRVVPGGRVSGHVAQHLKVGDAVKLSGPLGTAYLRRRHAGPVLCVAGGTGLAPVLAVLRGMVAAGMANPTHVYLGVRAARDVYGLAWLAALQQQHPALKIDVVVDTGPAAPGQRSGRVTDAVAQDHASLAGWRAYLCGPPPLVEAATHLVCSRGLDAALVHADAFYDSNIQTELA